MKEYGLDSPGKGGLQPEPERFATRRKKESFPEVRAIRRQGCLESNFSAIAATRIPQAAAQHGQRKARRPPTAPPKKGAPQAEFSRRYRTTAAGLFYGSSIQHPFRLHLPASRKDALRAFPAESRGFKARTSRQNRNGIPFRYRPWLRRLGYFQEGSSRGRPRRGSREGR